MINTAFMSISKQTNIPNNAYTVKTSGVLRFEAKNVPTMLSNLHGVLMVWKLLWKGFCLFLKILHFYANSRPFGTLLNRNCLFTNGDACKSCNGKTIVKVIQNIPVSIWVNLHFLSPLFYVFRLKYRLAN